VGTASAVSAGRPAGGQRVVAAGSNDERGGLDDGDERRVDSERGEARRWELGQRGHGGGS
jgi:hypothetical protein